LQRQEIVLEKGTRFRAVGDILRFRGPARLTKRTTQRLLIGR
jgi:hypothetical protein